MMYHCRPSSPLCIMIRGSSLSRRGSSKSAGISISTSCSWVGRGVGPTSRLRWTHLLQHCRMPSASPFQGWGTSQQKMVAARSVLQWNFGPFSRASMIHRLYHPSIHDRECIELLYVLVLRPYGPLFFTTPHSTPPALP